MRSDQYQDWPCVSTWVEQKVMRRQLTMLSDTNNIPPPATSPDSSSDDSSPPSSFIMATTIVNSISSVAALGIAIAGYVHSIRKDRRDSKKEKGKKKDEGIDLLRRVDEDMLLRITQLEQTVNRAGTLRNLGRH